MANKFQEEFSYYKDYMNQFFGGMSYLSPYENELFADMEKMIKKREGKLTTTALENLQRMGTSGSGVGQQFFTENVTEPVQEAYSQLDWQKVQAINAEKSERRKTAMAAAIQKIAEEKERKNRIWKAIGSIGGTVAGAALGIPGGPGGILAGASAGSQIGSALTGGGDGGGINWDEVMRYIEMMERGEITPGQFPEFGGGY